jgi:hypothetical protein
MEEIKEVMRIGESELIVFPEDENKGSITCDVIRGGIAWPSLTSPAYFCLIGRRGHFNPNFKSPLILLKEYEADLLGDLLIQLHEDARKSFCLKFYAEVKEGHYAFCDQFCKYMEKLRSQIELLSPDIPDWTASILQIQKYVKDSALSIPKETILHSQLGKMTGGDDEKDSQKAEFYAVNALRCVIGSFEIQPSYR